MSLLDFMRLKRMSIVAVLLSSLIAAISAAAATIQSHEGWWLASRDFVRHQVHASELKIGQSQLKLIHQQERTSLQVLENRRDTIAGKLSDRKLLLEQPGPASYRLMVQEQMQEFQRQLQQVDQKIQAVRNRLPSD